MAQHCNCSGTLVADDQEEDFAQHIKVMARVAKFHSMDWLAEVVGNLSC